MRTTLTLDDDVHRAVLELSRSSGDSLGAVVSCLARRGLQMGKIKPTRFPVFEVAPGTAMMTLENINRFVEEEGLF